MAATPDETETPAVQDRRGLRILSGAVAALLVLAAYNLPVWRAHLIAPQYPGGLHVYAYGHGMEGDIAEVDSLNHYVGMKAFNADDVPEMMLFPLGIGLAVAAVVVATLARRRWLVWLARAYLFALPVIILGDIQVRLYQYGHDLDPGAALRIPEFTPWVVGPTSVWNFTNVGYPGQGLIAIFAAALIVTFAARLLAKLGGLITNRGTAMAASAAAVMLVALAAAPLDPADALVATQSGPDDHHGHNHDHGTSTTVVRPHESDRRSSDRPRTSNHIGSGELHEMVAAARPGDTIVVPPGTYHGRVVIDVPVTLVGEGRPTVMGDGISSTLVIRAPGTTVRGLRVVGSGPGPVDSPSGVRVEASGVTVEDLVVEDAYAGISVVGASDVHLLGNTISGRRGGAIIDASHATSHDKAQDHGDHTDGAVPTSGTLRGDGINLWDVEGVVVRNNMIRNSRDGIYISFGYWVTIDANQVATSRYGVHTMYGADLTMVENTFEQNLAGLVLMYGGPALVLRNELLDNRSPSTGFGMILKDVVSVEVSQNVVARNRVGIHLEGPSPGEAEVRVLRNTIAANEIGVTLPPSARAVFSTNSFVDNLIQVGAHDIGAGAHVRWTDHGWGNYWSNYQGHESALAGRGSTPHHEGSRVDGIIERAPVLIALASSPGMRLIRSIESQRFADDPVVVDPIPLVRPVSPGLAAEEGEGSTGVSVAGMGLATGASIFIGWLHRPRRTMRSKTASRRNAS